MLRLLKCTWDGWSGEADDLSVPELWTGVWDKACWALLWVFFLAVEPGNRVFEVIVWDDTEGACSLFVLEQLFLPDVKYRWPFSNSDHPACKLKNKVTNRKITNEIHWNQCLLQIDSHRRNSKNLSSNCLKWSEWLAEFQEWPLGVKPPCHCDRAS